MQQARLRARVEIHLQRVVVLPGDVQPPGLTHDAADAECLALQARGIVLCEIPGVGRTRAGLIQRHAFVVALLRSLDAMAPVFADDRNPVAGEIDRRRRPCICRASSAPLREQR